MRMLGAPPYQVPEAGGIQPWPGTTLVHAHARLSLLDLSPAGTQSIMIETIASGPSSNGEIYNDRKFRGNLDARGQTL